MSKWISVEDMLPDNIDDVVIAGGYNGEMISTAGYYSHSHGWDSHDGSLEGESITHWMPLPEPPKGE